VAYVVDLILFALVYAVVAATSGGLTTTDAAGNTILNSRAQLVTAGFSYAYFFVMWTYAGRTVGQMALGMRIVRADNGAPIGPGTALVRLIGYVIASIPFGLGLIWAGFDARKQGWHDKIASTLVVRKSRV
jgi:uncharacterized RDD family membrane protein YckC